MLRSALFMISAGLLYLSCTEVGSAEAMHHCEACGTVCINFCNTRDFRPCCINYMRKRSPQPVATASESTEQRLWPPHRSTWLSQDYLDPDAPTDV
ncbi:Hypothetical predicted protein [Cloeon dipterum]|uniref:Secreted protein n=1 Tax=Cloeon dipterum TaxID=197152 RepID=A0A8S1CU14_9INSE|nr:Hypothetical predicted protein [Cloeon dipterum]